MDWFELKSDIFQRACPKELGGSTFSRNIGLGFAVQESPSDQHLASTELQAGTLAALSHLDCLDS